MNYPYTDQKTGLSHLVFIILSIHRDSIIYRLKKCNTNFNFFVTGCIQSQENIEAPGELSSLSRQSWIQWKNYYRRWLNYTCVPPYKETHTFFKYIGFLGDEISNNYLYFEKSRSEAKLKTLMFKFDVYFIFEEIRTKCANQSIHEYIISLKVTCLLF